MAKFVKKIIYNNRICGLFLLTDLFSIKNGTGNISEEGEYPQITATEFNNGHGGFIDKYEDEDAFTIAKDGKPGVTRYHCYKFGVNCHVVIAKPKIKIPNDYCTMYISAIMSSYLIPRYSYGRAAGLSRLKKQYIPLPITKDGDIDFEYMESVTKPMVNQKMYNIINEFKCIDHIENDTRIKTNSRTLY
jgi:hypothetical protein